MRTKVWIVGNLIMIVLVAVFLIAITVGSTKAQEPEPAYAPTFGYYDCWNPISWVGMDFVHPTIGEEDILRAVLYVDIPNHTESTWVFDYGWSYNAPHNQIGNFMSAVYPHPNQPYALRACVYDKSGGEYCTATDLVPACPFSTPQNYLPVVFN